MSNTKMYQNNIKQKSKIKKQKKKNQKKKESYVRCIGEFDRKQNSIE